MIKFKINNTVAGIAFLIGSFPKKTRDNAPTNIVAPSNMLAKKASMP